MWSEVDLEMTELAPGKDRGTAGGRPSGPLGLLPPPTGTPRATWTAAASD